MLKLRNFGKKCLEEVEKLFNSYNLSFGMDITKYKKKGARLEYKSL